MADKIGSFSYKIGIYVRESRDDNGENYETIETQRGLLADFVKKNNLGELCRTYIDDNVSGSSFERTGINMLRDDVVRGHIDMLLIKDLSRIGRNNAKTLLFLDFLEEYGVRVITADGRYDSLRDSDTVGIETWFNERYLRDISRKIRSSLRFKIEKGEHLGRAPYGYVKSNQEKNRLIIDNEKVQTIKGMFKLYKEGFGYESIANRLNSQKVPPPSGKYAMLSRCLWNAVAVRRILSNRVYIGDTVQGVSEKISFKSKKTRRLPQDNWVVTCDTHEPIISREEFEEVQKIRITRNGRNKPHGKKLHTLSGSMYCGRCGSMMFARTRKDRPMGYICGNYCKNGRRSCASHYIREDFVIRILTGEILDLFKSINSTEKIKVLQMKELLKKADPVNEADRLERLITARLKQQDILYMDRLEGKISEELFSRMNINIENSISNLRKESGSIKVKAVEPMNEQSLINDACKWIEEEGITREIVRLFVDNIIVFDGNDNLGKVSNEGLYQEQKDIEMEGIRLIISYKHASKQSQES